MNQKQLIVAWLSNLQLFTLLIFNLVFHLKYPHTRFRIFAGAHIFNNIFKMNLVVFEQIYKFCVGICERA